MSSTTTRITWEEFLDLPETPGKQELLDGELIALPPAKHIHMDIVQCVFLLLKSAVGGSRVRIEEGYLLKRGWLQPDVSVIWPDQPMKDGWFQRAPMVVIEVVSPSNKPADIDRKTAVYLEEGAAEVWVIYPTNHSMAVFRKESWERETESYTCALLNVTIDLRTLFPAAE